MSEPGPLKWEGRYMLVCFSIHLQLVLRQLDAG